MKYEGGAHARTSLTGVTVGVDVSAEQKVWRTFQALGDIAFAYAYSTVLIEIQASQLCSIFSKLLELLQVQYIIYHSRYKILYLMHLVGDLKCGCGSLLLKKYRYFSPSDGGSKQNKLSRALFRK